MTMDIKIDCIIFFTTFSFALYFLYDIIKLNKKQLYGEETNIKKFFVCFIIFNLATTCAYAVDDSQQVGDVAYNASYGTYSSDVQLTYAEKILVDTLIDNTLNKIHEENRKLNINLNAIVLKVKPSTETTYRIKQLYMSHLMQAREIKRTYDSLLMTAGHSIAAGYRNGLFVSLVRSGGEWDLKRQLGSNTYYTILGKRKNGEYIGNHHYGYMGRHIGYDLFTLKIGGGLYQIWSGTSDWSYVSSYFDDPKDSIAIEQGYRDWLHFN